MSPVRKGSRIRKSAIGSAAHRRSGNTPGGRSRRVLFAPVRAAVEVESPYAHRPSGRASGRRSARSRARQFTASRPGLHPYVRTMFLSLAVGTVMLLGSLLYYARVSATTEPYLEGRLITRESAAFVATSTMIGLERVDPNSDGVPVKPFPRAYLREKAETMGFNADLLERIAHCESNWRMVKNKKSTAMGFFQILDGTEKLTPQYKDGLSKEDPYVNIDMALALYEKYGTIPWYESRGCWER